MNPLTLLSVFVLGVIFAVLVPILRDTLNDCDGDNDLKKFKFHDQLSRSVGIFFSLPDAAYLNVMNDDYDPLENLKGHPSLKKSIARTNLKTEVDQISQEAEALSSLYAAIDMKKQGKHDKALKLFQHALALCSKQPDILNHYGEFLEETQKDLIAADHLYLRALTYSPDHLKALENRQRTLPLVQELDESVLRRIDEKRDMLINVPDSNAALRRVKKEAYFQHIYHTAAIEGNTLTLSQTRLIVETRLAVEGKSIIEHNEILGLDAALKYINTTLVHKVGRISVKDILEIHKRVIGFADPFEAGQFRLTQVYVGDYVPPSPSEIQLLMENFVQWLNSPSALQMHPVKYSALAHYKLVFIHPFSDGNGRTSRLLMNLILMQAGYPPVIIRKQERLRYYEFLEFANEGDVRPFVRFIADCTERTLDVYLWATAGYSSNLPALDQSKTIVIEDADSDEGFTLDEGYTLN